MLRNTLIAITLAAAAAAPGLAAAQVAGSTLLDTAQVREVALGWSAKKEVIGKRIYNDAQQPIGRVDDVVIAPDKSVSYAIVGAGGFLGVHKHDVAVPLAQVSSVGGRLVLAGATKEALKEMPAFEYAR